MTSPSLSSPTTLVLLVAYREETPPKPSSLPGLSTLMHWAEQEKVTLLYAAPRHFQWKQNILYASGARPDAASDSWCSVTSTPVHAVYNRFPRTRAPEAFAQVANGCREAGIPFGNPAGVQGLAWDKARTGRLLLDNGIAVPDWLEDTNAMIPALQQWKQAYFKPIGGAFGEDIAVLTRTEEGICIETDGEVLEPLSEEQALEWLENHNEPPRLFQQAVVTPFAGVRGLSIRSLVQQDENGHWTSLPRVARVSSEDPVANAARGATPLPLRDFLEARWGVEATQSFLDELDLLDQKIASLMSAAIPEEQQAQVVELGLDYVVDPERRPWCLEVNGFPQGRLERLLALDRERFEEAFREGHTRPLRRLLRLTRESLSF